MVVGRILRWLIALGVTVVGFAVVYWIAQASIGLDQATALTLAAAAAPVLASPFAWWATQPVEARSRRGRTATGTQTGAGNGHAAGAGGAFICYSQSDARRYALELAAFLEKSGVPAWLDKEIITGQRWTQIVESQLDRCTAVVVVMTPAGNRSEWVEREVAHARAAGKPILPMLREGRPFFSLGNLHYEDVTDGSMPGPGFVDRLRIITAAASAGQLAAPASPPAVAAEGAEPAAPVAAGRKRDRRVLVAAAAALVVVIGAVTAIVMSSSGKSGKKDETTSGSSGREEAPTAPGLAISPDGQWLYLTVNRISKSGGQTTREHGGLIAIDTQTRTAGVPMAIVSGAGDAAIDPDGKMLYVTSHDYFGGGVAIIMQLGANPIGITGIDLLRRPSPPPNEVSRGNRSIAVSPDGSQLYVADEATSTVLIGDPELDDQVARPGKTVEVNEKPRSIAVSPDGKRLYVAGGADHGFVTVMDTKTGAVINNSIIVGGDPRSMAISHEGTRVYVANYRSNTVSVIDTGTAGVIRQFMAGCGTGPTDVAVGRDANRVYVACETSNVVVAMDGTLGTVIGKPVEVGRLPSAMVVSPDGSRLYVANIETSTVNITVIDTATDTAIGPPIVADTWLVTGTPSVSASS